ncbi:juvenile hormone epoxide hydrolase 1-like [Eurosta solidaginis]|uniref:juvenile hormone epoxide hydrolase 1-like n=1 Tax=Eurosta solidaginis TaxID=178769 RepID=UPI003531674E
MGPFGFFFRLFVGITVVIAAYFAYKIHNLTLSAPVPHLNDAEYWGPGSASNYKENTEVKPFDISVKPELIKDLEAQLARPPILQEPLEGIGFQYGFNSKYLKDVVKYWRLNYLPKWSEREAFLKQFPHFETQIQGLRIHFIHVKPKPTKGKKVVPLLLLHGWPGSVREFYSIIPLLTKPNPKSDYVFEVIAPSLTGYGWSQGSSKTGFGAIQMAIVMRNLMLRVGHEKFLVQGGDWGSLIGSNIATLRPQNVLGYHSNLCNHRHPLSTVYHVARSWLPGVFVKEEHEDFFKTFGENLFYMMEESGYFHIQATKPDTIGTALLHNPVGLAAYILEKFSTWTNPKYRILEDGGLTKRFTMDELLDNIMIYYVTNSITTSQRLYSESFNIASFALNMDGVHVHVPTGCARFIHDLLHSTDTEVAVKFKNLIHSTYHKEGGHFAAMEVPQILYDDFVVYANKALQK